MSLKSLLTPEQQFIFHSEWHQFLSNAKSSSGKYHLNDFFSLLRRNYKDFREYSDKELSNKIIASRRLEGTEEWPNLNDIHNYISPYNIGFIIKAHQSALLAVEIYNKPLSTYRTEGFIVLMMIAWNSLFHAIFLNKGENIKYSEKGIDNYLDLRKCINKYTGKLKKEISANLELLIEIRDQIVHKENPVIDDKLFGYCQSCLLNFEEILVDNFGEHYQLPNTLAYSLQFSKIHTSQQVESIKNYRNRHNYKMIDFISEFETNLFNIDPEVYKSQNYCFRIYLIPKVVKENKAEAAVEYINYDMLDPDVTANISKAILVIKENRVAGEYYKASQVCKKINERLKNIKGPNWIFSPSFHHSKAAKYFNIREGYKTSNPEKTKKEYCYYDPLFKQYIYTKQWIDFLTNRLKESKIFEAILLTK